MHITRFYTRKSATFPLPVDDSAHLSKERGPFGAKLFICEIFVACISILLHRDNAHHPFVMHIFWNR